LGRHWRAATIAVVIVAVVASGGIWWALTPTGTSPATAVDCSTLEAADFGKAGALAVACKGDVEVLSERTPWQRSWATPEGEARLDILTVPDQVEIDGEWVPLDPSLVENPKTDTIDVAAAPFPIKLNAGGAAGEGKPLGSIERDGMTFDMWFPLDLPEPKVSGTQAVYDLGEGIRLIVSVNVGATGFVPVVELADAKAAERFADLLDGERADRGGIGAGLDLEFATQTSKGLSLVLDDENAVHAVDEAGATQFLAPPPIMWDSSGQSIPVRKTATEVGIPDRTRAPGEGDRITSMGVQLAGDTIVVSPDAAMIANPETVWPVYVDPSINAQVAAEWVAVRTGGYTGTLYNWGDISPSMLGQGTGYCTAVASCNVVFKQRLAWEYTGLSLIANMAGTDIISAQFRVNGVHSYNCTARGTYLNHTSTISTSSNWSNISWLSVSGSRTEYHSNSCGNTGFREFDATAIAVWAANNNQSTLTMGLAVDETNMNSWKRFRHDATLTVTYNRAPNTPTSLQLTSPSIPTCVTGATRPYIATTTPTVSAISSDPDLGNVQTAFVVARVADLNDVRWSSGNLAALASGLRKSAAVPSGLLVDGTAYAWRARAYDGARYSGWSGWCEFSVDTSAPVTPTVDPVTTGVEAIYLENAERGGVGLQGSFTIGRGASTDVVDFTYGFNAPSMPSTIAAGPGGTAVVTFDPTTTGPVTLTVKSRDAAGNLSPARTYTFTVATATADGIWNLDEGSGATAADSAGGPARALTLSGAQWGYGPHHLFDARSDDRALVLDGVNDYAASNGPVVDTTGSFAVSAHVWLDPASIAQSQSFAALSQDGVGQSGFRVGYSASCPGMPDGCWAFSMPDALTGSPETVVRSTLPVTGGEWVHLVAEFDADDDTLRLWVCEAGTPADPAIGEPLRSEVARTATPWAAAGAFTVGRAQASGVSTGWWPGSIDNVRLFSGDILAESKVRRLCQGAEATDFDTGDNALDPTTTVGE
jgi:hypothetical protein